MSSILLNKQKSQYISVKNAFQSSSFQVMGKIIQIFDYSGLTEKATAKEKYFVPKERSSSSFTVLSKKGYDNKADFKSYTAQLKMPCPYNTKQQVIHKSYITSSFTLKYF